MKNYWLDNKKEEEKEKSPSEDEDYDENGYYKNAKFNVMPKAFCHPNM